MKKAYMLIPSLAALAAGVIVAASKRCKTKVEISCCGGKGEKVIREEAAAGGAVRRKRIRAVLPTKTSGTPIIVNVKNTFMANVAVSISVKADSTPK